MKGAPVLHWPKLFEGQVGLTRYDYSNGNGYGNGNDGWGDGWGNGWGNGDDCEHRDGDGNGNGWGNGNGGNE
jgi:hypothetical protein